MTPRTRTSNQNTNFKVYYSKKVPQQVHFPHKKKTVHRLDSTKQDGVDKRQMRFLPQMMGRHKNEEEKEEEEEEELEEEHDEEKEEDGQGEDSEVGRSPVSRKATNADVPKTTPVHIRTGKRRQSKDVPEGSRIDDEVLDTSFKRQKRRSASKTKECSTANDNKAAKESSRTFRLQSTMTQLADGRRPSLDKNEPEFKPLKRYSRASWGGTRTEKERDKKQRTLTQMIPDIGRLSKEEIDELRFLDEELEESQTDSHRVSQCLAEQGLLDLDTAPPETAFVRLCSDTVTDAGKTPGKSKPRLPIVVYDQPSAVVQSVEEMASDETEDDYQPTQFIEVPSRRVKQKPGRRVQRQCSSRSEEPGKSAKSRFSLLSTPEKRQVFEIPSSQSPAEYILPSQPSSSNSNRFIVRECNSRITTIVAETPSKRRQVTFREPASQPTGHTCLRKFGSTVQDSEDEGESDIEDDFVGRGQIGGADQIAHSQPVSAETQTAPNQTDRVRTHVSKNIASNNCDSPEGPEKAMVRQGACAFSPELGGSWAPIIYDDDGPEYQSYRSTYSTTKSQPFRDVEELDINLKETPLTFDLTDHTQPGTTTKDTNTSSSTPHITELQTDGGLTSTTMVIRDGSDNEKIEPESMSQRAVKRTKLSPPSTTVHRSTHLDDGPIQVPRSPSVDRQTQQSYSSKAEQQLQNEWLSYSQYVNEGAPNSSNMHAATDVSSYNATPQLPRAGVVTASSACIQHSQATTVDEVTPKKNRMQFVTSSNTTPRRISKSRSSISPDKPPPLFIPSSFPSPSIVAMEGWSSPVMSRTQNPYGSSLALGSLEDFSIPLPPPSEDD